MTKRSRRGVVLTSPGGSRVRPKFRFRLYSSSATGRILADPSHREAQLRWAGSPSESWARGRGGWRRRPHVLIVKVHMRLSQTLVPTLKEAPAEAEVPSHIFMMRGGFLRKVAAGIYSFLPLGWRVVQKVSRII